MTVLNLMDFLTVLAADITKLNPYHQAFIIEACLISETVQKQLVKNNAMFRLEKLHTTAAYVHNILLDMPLNFEVFLPVSLPLPVTCSFDEERRTVLLTRYDTHHPFFFGNAVNFKLMNLVLQKELAKVVKQLRNTTPFRLIYDLSYTVQRRGNVPFLHQLVATKRGWNDMCCIRFDFVLALSFDCVNVPLPAYYKAPLMGQWLAYGIGGGDRSPTEWSVLVPKWKDADASVCLRSLSTLNMLHRLLKVQKCDLYAQPSFLKLAFVMVTEESGEGYQQMSVANMSLATLFHHVVRDLYQAAMNRTRTDKSRRSSKLLAIRKQQLRARAIYYILAHGASQNMIDSKFTFAFFTNLYFPPPPSWSKWYEIEEVDIKPAYDFPLEIDSDAPSLKRRKNMRSYNCRKPGRFN